MRILRVDTNVFRRRYNFPKWRRHALVVTYCCQDVLILSFSCATHSALRFVSAIEDLPHFMRCDADSRCVLRYCVRTTAPRDRHQFLLKTALASVGFDATLTGAIISHSPWSTNSTSHGASVMTDTTSFTNCLAIPALPRPIWVSVVHPKFHWETDSTTVIEIWQVN